MTPSTHALRSPARGALLLALLAALALSALLAAALCAPERARSAELPQPQPRPPLLDVPPMSPDPVPAQPKSKH